MTVINVHVQPKCTYRYVGVVSSLKRERDKEKTNKKEVREGFEDQWQSSPTQYIVNQYDVFKEKQ